MAWLNDYYLWIKSFHIFFMVCWFAGIFYLPRLFVNHAMAEHQATAAQLGVMERKLYRFITPFAVLTVLLGIALMAARWDYFAQAAWMHGKLTLVVILLAYHWYCGRIVKSFARGENRRGHRFYRWFNEFPVLLLLGIVLLVELQPF
ncbi:protoporphyrinogen oxidase HemJ [Gilvimarinus sp. F26214L]|uniref:protoporphyrinogen oxidase HemJ n=1 Tax=Gilvimarinus sp. DZF01 TaxID=3461371 RepID=UPI0040461432